MLTSGQGFADKRKKKIQYEYRKMLHKDRKAEAAKQGAAGTSQPEGQKQFR